MRRFRFWNKKFVSVAVSAALSASMILCLGSPAWAFETFEEVKARTIPSESILYDRNHQIIHETRRDMRVRQLEWVPLSMISPALKQAVLISEDKRFLDHSGVDWIAFAKSAVQNVWGSHARGASTITMQLASFLDLQLVPRKLRRGVTQKIKQVGAARELEKQWNKDQILEAYLNLVTFRGELRGIGAASYGLFGKAPHGLDQQESLILASLIRSPEARMDQIEGRACELGKRIHGAKFSCAAIRSFLGQKPFLPQSIRPQMALAPHVARQVLKGTEAEVTLDRKLQEFVLEALQKQVLSVRDQNVHDGAALVVDNSTGQVLAYVGSIGSYSSAPHVDGVRALRQAGSTLKPFLYGLALEKKYLTPASLMDDSVLDIPIVGGIYRPQNYDHDYHGSDVNLRTALASSLNVPAVRTINLVGVEHFVRKLRALGFESLREAEYYGPSLALGSADVSLWELVNAYRTLAMRGRWSELSLQKGSSGAQQAHSVFTPDATFLISDILSDRESRSVTFGLENPLSLRFWVAAKTGTSKDMRDNWCIGFSERYTVGVWVGNFSGESMWNVTGVTGAAPAWADIMKKLHRNMASRAPKPTKGVVRSQIGNRAEWFIRGTEPSAAIAKVPDGVRPAKITYPADGMMIARDPDIPKEIQRVVFESSSRQPGLKWLVNGQEVGKTWEISDGGSFQLSLTDSEGNVLDTVNFSVR